MINTFYDLFMTLLSLIIWANDRTVHFEKLADHDALKGLELKKFLD